MGPIHTADDFARTYLNWYTYILFARCQHSRTPSHAIHRQGELSLSRSNPNHDLNTSIPLLAHSLSRIHAKDP